ncbi:piwi-like protein Siwi [Dermacentor silvarum]|uniref:piwi-like protein Siwi n=1 Tax=Dermacentor silvarum TaxID=543639 RepID=UPI00189946B7|nr:piwi-like protein Siwi [Dermacentor silvarum]
MSEPTGRARGRSRGKSRGTAAPTQQESAIRRPGFEGAGPYQLPQGYQQQPGYQQWPGYQQQPPAYQQQQQPGYQQSPGYQQQLSGGMAGCPPQQQAPPPQMPPTGRAGHRSAGVMARPGEVVPPQLPIEQMGAMSLAGGDTAGRGARRGHRDEIAILATRPQRITDKKGTTGNPVKLLSNYFRLLTMPSWAIQQYHVEFAPNIESSRLRGALLRDHRDRFGGSYIFDGMSDLKSATRLEHKVTELYSQRHIDGAQICIIVKHVQELAPNNPELLRIFNTQMRRNLESMQFVQIRRQFFNSTGPKPISRHGLEIWEGLTTAVGQHDGGVLMVVDTVHKVLRTENVLHLLGSLQQTARGNYKDEAIKAVVGCIVMTRYNNKTYRVDDIDWTKNPQQAFETKEGPITYLKYYKDHYQKDIRDLNQPLLVCRPRERDIRVGRTDNLYLIPELCFLTGLTDDIRSNFSIMKDLASEMKLDPAQRVANLQEFMQNMSRNQQVVKEMGQWGLKFSESLVEIDARQVQPERVIHGNNIRSNVNPMTADFSREMRDKNMFKAIQIRSWVVVCTRCDMQNAQDFVRELMCVGPPMGVTMQQPQLVALEDDRVGSYINGLKNIPRDTELLMAVFPNNRKDRYDCLKKVACVDMGLHTQVMLGRTISNKKNLKSVATKVAIQMNCKLGGEAWAVEIPLQGAMCIGYDTYHDCRQKGLSAGGFVASLNKTLTRWYSRVSFHQAHQELGSALKTHLALSLKQYQEENNTVPKRILFFRDGVSDGQLLQVQEWEVGQIQSLLTEMFPGREPQLAFVVVTKRIATRFFSMNRGRGYQNPPPGTVIDNNVTRPEWYDFYLISQSVRQGTVAPTHFNVIHDTTMLKPEHMQRLSYKLTHLYFNWPGTIRVPAPCQYAHKLAFLAGQSLHAEPHKNLATTLFYL